MLNQFGQDGCQDLMKWNAFEGSAPSKSIAFPSSTKRSSWWCYMDLKGLFVQMYCARPDPEQATFAGSGSAGFPHL